MDLDQTQALELDDYFDQTQALADDIATNSQVGYLKVLDFQQIPEITFPIFEGVNFIGRDEKCNITIAAKPISKKHACIEVQDGTMFVYDCGSLNKSKKNNIVLKPQVRYEICDNDQLTFADVNCKYYVGNSKQDGDDNGSETASETGSESMMPESNEELELDKKGDSVLTKPTQDCTTKNTGNVSPVFCAETDEETEDETDDEGGLSKKGFSLDITNASVTSLSGSPGMEAACPTLLYTQARMEEEGGGDSALPHTVPVDTIPCTPGVFARDVGTDDDGDSDTSLPPLQRAVDVRTDPFKRLSKGNTLEFGLQTPDTSTCSRESRDASGTGEGTVDISPDQSSAATKIDNHKQGDETEQPEKAKEHDVDKVAVTLDFQEPSHPQENTLPDEAPPAMDEVPGVQTTGGETPLDDNESERTQEYANENDPGMQEKDGNFDDFATQAYALADDVPKEDTPMTYDLPTLAYDLAEEETGDEFATQAYGFGSGGPGADTGDELATQAYGLVEDKEDEKTGDELATQAYGLESVARVSDVETGDELVTQAYGLGDENAVSEGGTSDEFPILGGKDAQSSLPNKDISKVTSEVNKKRQMKVTFTESNASEISPSKSNVKPVETSEVSSDNSELPSLDNILGITEAKKDERTSDNEEELLDRALESLRNRNLLSETVTSSAVKKSPSVVIEGERKLSSRKRCYVECTPENEIKQIAKINKDTLSESKDENSESPDLPVKGRGRLRRSGARKGRTAEQAGDNEDEKDTQGTKGLQTELVSETSTKKKRTSRTARKGKAANKDGEGLQDTSVVTEEVKGNQGLQTAGRKGRKSKVVHQDNDAPQEKNKDTEGSQETLGIARGTRGSRKTPGRKKDKVEDNNGLQGTPEDHAKTEERLGIVRAEEDITVGSEEALGDGGDAEGTTEGKGGSKRVTRGKRGKRKIGEDNLALQETTGVDEGEEEIGEGNKGSEGTLGDREGLAEGKIGSKGTSRKRGKNDKDIKDVHDFSEPCGKNESEGTEDFEFTNEKEKPGKRKRTASRARTRGKTGDEVQLKESEIPESTRKGRSRTRKASEKSSVGDEKRGKEPLDTNNKVSGEDKINNTTEKQPKKVEEKNENLKDDPFEFDDVIPAEKPAPVPRQQRSRMSASARKTASKPRGRKKQEQEMEMVEYEDNKTDNSKSTFVTPEAATTGSQRSRRSSTSSETSTRSTQKRRRTQKSESDCSPDLSAVPTGTPKKKTKLDLGNDSGTKVMFTGLAQEAQVRKIVEDLRGDVVESVFECTHLVTDKIRRTVKLLCAVCRGIPVVDKKWLAACKKSKSFVDCSKFIVSDKPSEKQHEFSLERSLETAKSRHLLQGYKVHVTANVAPKPDVMKDIVLCAKGEYLSSLPSQISDKIIVISCEEDKKVYEKYKGHVCTSELLLTGVLRQEIDLKQYEISPNQSQTPSKKGSRRR